MVNNFKFDYVSFEVELRNHALQAFNELRSRNKTKTIYCYGLEAHAEFEILYPFIVTDENWRWETCATPERAYDLEPMLWKLHHIIHKGMRSLDGMAVSAKNEGYMREQIAELVKAEESQYKQACVEALKDLDRKGFFGQGIEREKISVILAFTGYPDVTLIKP